MKFTIVLLLCFLSTLATAHECHLQNLTDLKQMHDIAIQGDTLNKGTNHEPIDIIARTNELSPNISVKSLITRLSTDDPDTLDVHVYEVLPAADTDYDKVKVVADQLWLIKPLEEGQTTLKARLRATDEDGAFVEKMLRFEVVKEEKKIKKFELKYQINE